MSGLFVSIKTAIAKAIGTLSGPKGAGLLGFMQTGTGAILRTVEDDLRETVKVTQFGADPTGTTDSTAAFTAAQNAGSRIIIPEGTFLLTNFRHKNGKRFECAGAATIIKQGNPALPAWNILSDASLGQLIDIALVGWPTLQGAANSTAEILRMEAMAPYAIQGAKIEVRGRGGYSTLRMVTSAANEIYASEIKVIQTTSINTGCILSGIYNTYWLHIAGAQNGIAFTDAGWNSVFLQAVSEGMQQITGQNATIINPTVESWVGSAQYGAMVYTGLNPTIINANVVNVPAAKAPIGLVLNGGGGAPFNLLGFRVIGAETPTYPMEIPAGNTGLISSAQISGGLKISSYVPASILQKITFTGDCSTLTDSDGRNYTGSMVYDPPSLANGASTGTLMGVSGARLGDYVASVSFSQSTQGVTLNAMVTDNDTVTVRFYNGTGSTVDLPSGTLRVKVSKV